MALDLGTLRATIEVSTEGAAASIEGFKDKYNKSLQDIQKSQKNLTKLATDLGNVGSKMTKSITLPVVALGTACVVLASNMTETQNKVETVFGSLTTEVQEWASSSIQNMGLAQQTALDMAGTFGDMATGMGLSTAASADMSMNLVQLAADLSSFKNISVETANTALTGVFTGEGESLKGLGIIMNDTTLTQYAMNQGIKTSYSEMTQAEKVQLRYNYVMSQTSNAQGDFAKTGGSVANSSKKVKEQIKELGTQFGSVLLPVVSKVIGVISNLLSGLMSMDDGTRTVVVAIVAFVAAIGPVLSAVASCITAVQGLSAAMTALNISTGGVMAIIGLAAGAIAALVGIFSSTSTQATQTATDVDTLTTSVGNLDNASADISVTVGDVETAVEEASPSLTAYSDAILTSEKNSRALKTAVKEMNEQVRDSGQAQKDAAADTVTAAIANTAALYAQGLISREEAEYRIGAFRNAYDISTGAIDENTDAQINLNNKMRDGASNGEILDSALGTLTTSMNGQTPKVTSFAAAMEQVRDVLNLPGVDTSSPAFKAALDTAAGALSGEYSTALTDADTLGTTYNNTVSDINTNEADQVAAVESSAAAIRTKSDCFDTYIANRKTGMTEEENWASLEKQYGSEVTTALQTELNTRFAGYSEHNRTIQDARVAFHKEAGQAEKKAATDIETIHTTAETERQTAAETYYEGMRKIGATFNQTEITELKQHFIDVGDTDSAAWVDRIAQWSSSASTLNSENASEFVSIGQESIAGWVQGLDQNKDTLLNKARQIANQVKQILQKSYDIHSPSRWFKNMIGKNMIKGWEQGIDEEAPSLFSTVEAVTRNIKTGSSSALEAAQAATFRSTERRSAPAAANTSNSVVQNNTFTSKELTPYEQRMELRKLDKDLAGVFA